MKKNSTYLAVALQLIATTAAAQPDAEQAWSDNNIDRLLSQLTLEEKVLLTSGRDAWSTQPIDRLDIPSIWMADGPHGLRRAPSTDTWGYGDQHPATCFPTASALSATWDVALLNEVGAALGNEASALGVNMLLGPGVNIKRSALGGRNFEYFSEDPYLAGKLGAAYIDGVQAQGVGTSLKHFVANNVETERMWANSDVDERTLNEIYLTPFEIAVREAQPWSVMACYNRVQGVYGSQSRDMLTRKLKQEWGFKGVVVSDWDAVIDRVEGIRAGMHIEMPGKPGHITNQILIDAVKSGELEEAQLDRVVRDILRVVVKANAVAETGRKQNLDDHHTLARRVASEAITLLKNDGAVLPLTGNKYRKIAVIGEFAMSPRYQGNGSSEVKPPRIDKFMDIIGQEFADNFEIEYAQGYSLADDADFTMIEAASRLAAESDVALVLAGLPLHYESEGIDRKHIDLPPSHNRLIAAIAEKQANTVVVLTNGSAVAMPWVDTVPAVVEAWLGGQAGAGAVADVVFGKVNPSGKLAETFPLRLEDTPAFLNFPAEAGEVLYGERVFVGYRYYDKRKIAPLFPFGHGLSYTEFSYSDLEVSSENLSNRESLTVTVTVTNTGKVTGKEVVQLYVQDEEASVQRPEKELKGFHKLELAPGASQQVQFSLAERDFSFYSTPHERWLAESGDFQLLVGASSRDIRLQQGVTLQSVEKLHYRFTEYTFFRELWSNPEMKPLLIELMPKWLGTQAGEGNSLDAAVIQDFIQDQPMIKFPYFTIGEVTAEQIKAFIAACNAMTYTP
ncbi:MAG: glycosyl hydrolase [Gammaproteobacteria bacterium]|nr:glycosyl hydrolase [Gammaproteobacteria bacterium]